MKRILFAALLIFPLLVAGQKRALTLKGHISGWKGKTFVYLAYVEKEIINDSTLSTDGHFEFKLNIIQPVVAYIGIHNAKKSGTNDNRKVFLDFGNITIVGKDSLKHSIVKGSKANDDSEKLDQLTHNIFNRIIEIKNTAIKTPVAERKGPAFEAINKEYYLMGDSLKHVWTRFIIANPQSFVSLVTLEQMAGASIDYQKTAPLFYKLNAGVRNTPLGKAMEDKLAIAKATGIGAIAPTFTALDTARMNLKLEDVLKKGKLTLIDFWASWCGPCRAENPNVVKTYNTFHDKGFNILSVSLDDNLASWKKAILKDGMPWYHVSGLKKWNEPIALLYGVRAVPDNILLDEKGKVIARGLRGEVLYKKIESLLQAEAR
jgi:thiol-disulfide isomerase/thioredoxin